MSFKTPRTPAEQPEGVREGRMDIEEMRTRFHCSRRLGLAPRLASRALLRLRRDTPGARRRWTLGRFGSFEMQADLVGISASPAPEVHIPGRLWDPAGTTMTGVDVEITPVGTTGVDVAIVPAQRLPEWFREGDLEHWDALVHAALDELCEELLWYASREDVATDAGG
jgi:hypothetical protein